MSCSFRRRLTAASVLLALLSLSTPASAQAPVILLPNGSFEGGGGSDGQGGGVPLWTPYGGGYEIDRTTHHEGDQSIRCVSVSSTGKMGASASIQLNQARPTPILVAGWSKADGVQGARGADYSLYVDLEYRDGTPLWGQLSPFSVGTHDWERRQVVIFPRKPVKSITIYALFRSHIGTVWFDDFEAHQLEGAGIFDGQPIKYPQAPPDSSIAARIASGDGLRLELSKSAQIVGVQVGGRRINSGTTGGFFVRDVAAQGPLLPVRGFSPSRDRGTNIGGALPSAHLLCSVKLTPGPDSITIDGEVTDRSNSDRAVTVYMALPIHADGWKWGQDIRTEEPILADREYSNQTRVNLGATGALSLYPFASVSTAAAGVGIANQMDWPGVYRIFYNGPTRQLVIAWDFGLTGKIQSWLVHTARFRCRIFRLPAATADWGFRAAAARFYQINSAYYTRRAAADGIWMPFVDPSTVPHHEDFGFAYHEGDNSIRSDDKLGILSFRYTEPMTYWMPMARDVPRTYDAVMEIIKRDSEGTDAAKRDLARSVINSGTLDADGRYNLTFENAPWTNGACFVLDPNPDLPATPEAPTKASLAYTMPKAAEMYGDAAKRQRGEQDGEYLDSLEGWSDFEDYRPLDLFWSPYPLSFDADSRQPVLPEWYSTHAFTRFLHDDLHNREKLLMANDTPVRFTVFSAMLDVMGIEVNWLDGEGKYRPDDDAIMNLRRTMSAQKPYLLLMNTNFDRFGSLMVERYFRRCLFYGIFPSMFSADASSDVYWNNPAWYNRDRALFKRYIPIIKRLSAAGWQPITYARSGDPQVYVERFGTRLLTVQNASGRQATAAIRVETAALGLAAGALTATDLLSGKPLRVSPFGTSATVEVPLEAGESTAIELR